MKHIIIKSCPGFKEWRDNARTCLLEGHRPECILWQNDDFQAQDLFSGQNNQALNPLKTISVSKEFLELADYAACHSSPDRFSLLYRILWRICHENRNLLHYKTDSDILKLQSYVKAVRRDAYKIKAFLRFREAKDQDHFIAWYEPEHYSLELSLPFFQTRFKNMNWSILTPYMTAHWDGHVLTCQGNPDKSVLPDNDNIETYWLKYYATTFNPARPKKSAMLNQMPKKYWKNMPETVLVKDLLRDSEKRSRKMIEDSRSN